MRRTKCHSAMDRTDKASQRLQNETETNNHDRNTKSALLVQRDNNNSYRQAEKTKDVQNEEENTVTAKWST